MCSCKDHVQSEGRPLPAHVQFDTLHKCEHQPRDVGGLAEAVKVLEKTAADYFYDASPAYKRVSELHGQMRRRV